MVEIILTVIGLIGTIGLTAIITAGATRKKAAKEADITGLEATNNAVDLADKIAKKYNEHILATVSSDSTHHNERHDQLDTNILEIKNAIITNCQNLSNITEYLNGDYQKFLKKQAKLRK
ncbi:MAG: hypothetical protein LBS50_10975 [Prevotellaceae bacterium]|jgi:hypothetical protein|nr:hypothetical protein [Prevotellaceae bacterium]